MKESIRELKRILKKNQKTNFWTALNFLMVEVGKDQYESFLVARKIFPNMTESIYNLATDYNTSIMLQIKRDVKNPEIEAMIDKGLNDKINFDKKDTYVETLNIKFPHGVLCKHIVALYKVAGGKMYEDNQSKSFGDKVMSEPVVREGILGREMGEMGEMEEAEEARPMEMGEEVRPMEMAEEARHDVMGYDLPQGMGGMVVNGNDVDIIEVQNEARPLRDYGEERNG